MLLRGMGCSGRPAIVRTNRSAADSVDTLPIACERLDAETSLLGELGAEESADAVGLPSSCLHD